MADAIDLTATAQNTTPTGLHELIELPTPVVIEATNGGTITFAGRKDDKVLLYFVNDEAAENTITLIESDGYGGAGNLTLTLAASASYLVQIESARFVQESGTYKGKLQITTADAANVRCAAIVLH